MSKTTVTPEQQDQLARQTASLRRLLEERERDPFGCALEHDQELHAAVRAYTGLITGMLCTPQTLRPPLTGEQREELRLRALRAFPRARVTVAMDGQLTVRPNALTGIPPLPRAEAEVELADLARACAADLDAT